MLSTSSGRRFEFRGALAVASGALDWSQLLCPPDAIGDPSQVGQQGKEGPEDAEREGGLSENVGHLIPLRLPGSERAGRKSGDAGTGKQKGTEPGR